MNHFLFAFLSLFASVTFIVLSVMRANADIYTDAKDVATCASKTDSSSKTCGIWQDNMCMKGTCTNCVPLIGDCSKKADYLILVFVTLAMVFFVLFIVFAVMGFVQQGRNKNNFAYHSAGGSSCGSSD